MKTVFLAWQDKAKTRRWFPVGRLDASDAGYVFQYVNGAKEARDNAGFFPLFAFPDFQKTYESPVLFPTFQNRVMNNNREDFREYLEQLDLNQLDLNDNISPLEMLAVDGGQRTTDHFEVCPLLECDDKGRFSCRFFLHGSRYMPECAQEKMAECVKQGDSLQVALELTNPKTKIGLQIQTMDYCMVGWAPRYLAYDLSIALKSHDETPEDLEIHVVKVNRDAPINQRYLIEFNGRFNYHRPMQSDEFQPLS